MEPGGAWWSPAILEMSPHTGVQVNLLVLSLCLGQAQSGVSVGAAAGGAAHVLFGGHGGGGGGGGGPRERDEETEALVIFMMTAAAGGIREGYNVENNNKYLYESIHR